MKKVYDFNQVRNEFELDEELEVNMLKEEVKEFYDALTLAERIDAMVDVRYVYEGTQMKYNAAFLPLPEEINKIVGQFHRISTTIVAEEMGDDSQFMDKILNKAWDIVCEINAEKINKRDENGKVMKQEGLRNATVEIAQMLEELEIGVKKDENE
jgi:hypothetical protein